MAEIMFEHTIERAIIMAAGIGQRLRPVTLTTPKPLVTVNGVCMIDTIIAALHENEIHEIYVVVGYLKEQFYEWAKKYNGIMDGRDIGTTILPNAQVKIFLTASPEVRAERRYKELKEKGVDVSYEETLANVIRRDKQDEKQSKAAEDSILLDNSELDFDGTVNHLLEIVEERTGVKHG